MKTKLQKILKELSKEMPGTGIILIPKEEDGFIQTNISMVEDNSLVLQHMIAFIELMNNRELYNKVLDAFEEKGRDLKILSSN